MNRGGESKVRFDVSSSDGDSTSENLDENEINDEDGNQNQDDHDEPDDNPDPDYVEEEVDATQQESTVPTNTQPRRSARTFTKTKPFWVSLSAHALSARVVPISYKKPTTDC